MCHSHRKFNESLKSWINFEKVHRVTKFNQKVWLKSYIDMNNKLRQKTKNNFEKESFKLMIKASFGKIMENVRKHRNIKLVPLKKELI